MYGILNFRNMDYLSHVRWSNAVMMIKSRGARMTLWFIWSRSTRPWSPRNIQRMINYCLYLKKKNKRYHQLFDKVIDMFTLFSFCINMQTPLAPLYVHMRYISVITKTLENAKLICYLSYHITSYYIKLIQLCSFVVIEKISKVNGITSNLLSSQSNS